MAKLREVLIVAAFDGARGRSSYAAWIEYSTKYELFYIRIQPHMLVYQPPDKEVLGWLRTIRIQGTETQVIFGGSEKEVRTRAGRHLAEFLHADAITRKVILFKVLYKADQIYSPDVVRWRSKNENTDPEYTLEVDYLVATELKSGDRTTYTIEADGKPKDVSRFISDHEGQVMEWTEDRETFFMNFSVGPGGNQNRGIK